MHLSALIEMVESGLADRVLVGSGNDALTGEQQWSESAEALQRNRESGCFPRLEVLRNSLADSSEFDALRSALNIGERSRYFGLFGYVSSGRSGYTSFSLLRHEGPGAGQIRVLLRHTAP